MASDSKLAVWGPKLTTKSYILEMKDDNFFDPVFKLPGFSLAAPEAETQDAVMIRTFTLEGGFIREREFYARKAYNRSFSYELITPPGYFWNAIERIANARGTCFRDFFLNHLCPTDTRFAHFFRLPDTVIDELLPNTAFVATTEDEEAFTNQTTLRSNQRMLYYALGVTRRMRIDTTAPYQQLYAAAFRFDNCQNCPLDSHQNAVVGGGDGTAVPLVHVSDDRFATSDAVTNSLSSGSIITDVYANGDVIIWTWADETVFNADSATTGGVLLSTNGGTTTSIPTSPTVPLYGIAQGNGVYVAVGADGAIWRSVDGNTWTVVTNNTAATGDHYTDVAFDPENGAFYISGFNAAASVAHKYLDGVISDLTTDVNAGSNALYRVAVLEKNHVVFGGLNGTVRENPTAGDGGTYSSINVAGTTSAVMLVGGDKARSIVGAGTSIYERSRITDDIYEAMTINPGSSISGNITGGAIGETFDGVNYVIAVTDQSEVLILNGYYPNA